MKPRLGQIVRILLFVAAMVIGAKAAFTAPYAAMVMDMRTGQVIHSRNADTQLHPASLTKMMTLYIAFEAIEHGEISLDTIVTISKNAAAEPPSKLGLRAGQKIALRYLIRAAAVKSANDAATAIGEAIEGSQAAFARRMNRTAQAMGMTRTRFKNMNGLTEAGHMSTARDMTTLGRHVFFDYPEYYNLFSRLSTDIEGRKVANTNRRFLSAYRGADGIKTGYTNAAGFNLVASAERDGKRIIATVFGGQSTASRNKQVAELLDMGFRQVPTRVAMRPPGRPGYQGPLGGGANDADHGGAGKTIRLVGAPSRSIRPKPRPDMAPAPSEEVLVALGETVNAVIEDVVEGLAASAPGAEAAPAPDQPPDAEAVAALAPKPQATPAPTPEVTPEVTQAAILVTATAPQAAPAPPPRPEGIILASVERQAQAEPVAPEIVTRLSTSGGRHWAISVGRYASQYEAERVLLKTALVELSTLGEALRKVARSPQGFDANFVGLTEESAELACRRLEARSTSCRVIGPS